MRKNDISVVDIPLALLLLTRLPIPQLASASFQRQSHSVWAFPLAGVAVLFPACLLGSCALLLDLPAALVAGLVLLVQILLTGAMHDDGLADCADGFWGGFDPARRLEIMKDSQIGSYGVLALLIATGLRWQAIMLLIELDLLWGLLPLAALSRAMMPVLMVWLPNARRSGLSQSVGRPSRRAVGLGLSLAITIALPFWGLTSIAVVSTLAIATLAVGLLARSKIGGQTGDVLGACQQLCEIGGLLTLLVIFN